MISFKDLKNYLSILPHQTEWFITRFFSPFLPYIIGLLVRAFSFIGGKKELFNFWTIINPTDIALFLTITSFFVWDSIGNLDMSQENDTTKTSIIKNQFYWMIFGIISFVSFVLNEYISIHYYCATDNTLEMGLQFVRIFTIVFFVFLIAVAKRTQSSFKLKANL